jgi:hypothetical protein
MSDVIISDSHMGPFFADMAHASVVPAYAIKLVELEPDLICYNSVVSK